MVRIGLDMRPTEPGFKAHFGRGTGRYTTELVKALGAYTGSSNGVLGAKVSLEQISSEQLMPNRAEASLLSLMPFGKTTLSTQLVLPRRLKNLNYDLVHFFAHGDAPALSSLPYVTTVLDLIPLKFPKLYRAEKANWRFRFARYLENRVITQATGLLAISESTKRDVVNMLGVDPERIVVTPLAVSAQFFCDDASLNDRFGQRDGLKELFNIPAGRPVLLYLGGIDPRKNVFFLLDVFKELLTLGGKEKPVLVVAGKFDTDASYPALLKQIDALGIGDDLKLVGFVPDDQLSMLYSLADLFVFPSLYEGFGFPVLEAMAGGVPVVAGNNSSLPEVVGDTGVLLTDNAKKEWVQSIKDLLGNSERRMCLSHAGRKRANAFSWEATAKSTIDAYLEFSGRSVRRLDEFNSAAALGR